MAVTRCVHGQFHRVGADLQVGPSEGGPEASGSGPEGPPLRRSLYLGVLPAPVPGLNPPADPYWLFSLQTNSIKSPAPVSRSGRIRRALNCSVTGCASAPGSSRTTSLTSVP